MSDPIHTKYPPGHFYSPIVNPREVTDYVTKLKLLKPHEILGISLNIQYMRDFWEGNVSGRALVAPSREKVASSRYFSQNESFGAGDAIMLSAMLRHDQPKQVIEVGSGFSTLQIIDVLEASNQAETRVTVIDPYPDRLKRLLSENDLRRIDLIESPIQLVDLERFEQLESGDMLFIDSTHVLKTGSDVHYEITRILPRLKSGVRIHFHDIQYPFEYPDAWINELNLSWNEAYAIQAFLMFNTQFEVSFFNNLFGRYCQDLVSSTFPTLGRPAEAFGGSLWLLRK